MADTLRIVLLGKTGCGKSSLANTILGKDVFEVKNFTSSAVTHCQAETQQVHDWSLTVVDTPGFFHSGLSEKEQKRQIERCTSECAPGPHAFLLVLKVEKFTEQERRVVRIVQECFSAEVFKYSTVVFTHNSVGVNYKSSLHPVTVLQKRAIRIIHNVGYYEHTNPLFIISRILKFDELVEFKMAQFMFKVSKKLLPEHIQSTFSEREGGYNLRGHSNFKIRNFRTTRKSFCISIKGVKLWNKLHEDLKQSNSLTQFKRKYKEVIFNRYTHGDRKQ